MTPRAHADDFLKKPNVSGQFYPANPKEISQFIDEAFGSVQDVPQDKKVGVLISPHAGYVFSGGVAAYGYKAVQKNHYTTVVVIGPSHFHAFEGASIWPKGKFETPLGTLDVDSSLADALRKEDPDLQYFPGAFSPEHSLEVQLPFIQKNFPGVKIVPILMGNPNLEVCKKFAQALNDVIGERDDVLVLISTDLSHYHAGGVARPMDEGTLKAIIAKDAQAFWNGIISGKMEACGFTSVVVGVLYAQLRGLNGVELLRYAHSGDVTGDNSRVVGYSSIIFYRSGTLETGGLGTENSLSAQHKKRLIAIARDTVDTFVKTGKVPGAKEADPRLNKIQGAFVTLTKHGQLRGCIGNIIGQEPLWQTVRDMAVAAASQDPRFPPVTAEELKDIEVEVSVLSVPQKISDPQKEIQLGIHGVIVSRGPFNHGVFLPQVATETGWGLDEFMGQLCSQKAGLPGDCWKDQKTTVEVFTADVFSEKDLEK